MLTGVPIKAMLEVSPLESTGAGWLSECARLEDPCLPSPDSAMDSALGDL